MGSYNDQGFSDDAVEERFSVAANQLYAAVLTAYAASYNAFGAPDTRLFTPG